MNLPEDLLYTRDHEWVRREGNVVTIGVTDYAAEALGEIVFVALPVVGKGITPGEPCGEIESTKSVSDIVSPVAGDVVELNSALDSDPAAVNRSPYGDGWLLRVEVSGGGDDLLTAEQYRAYLAEA